MRELYRTADAILNVCGTQELNDDLLHSERILYVESDPGVEQILVDQGEAKPNRLSLAASRALHVRREHRHARSSPFPLHQFQWLPTRQPVVTDFWKTDAPPSAGAFFTSVANWNTSGQKDIEWRGEQLPLEQVARVSEVRRCARRARRDLRARDRHPGPADRDRFLPMAGGSRARTR